MDELDSQKMLRHENVVTGEWLLPSAALDRFDPPPNIVLSEAPEKEAGRYGFRIGTLGLLIQPGCGSEVMQMPMIWTLPGAPPWFLGLINLRGNLVPVFDLRLVLGLGQRQADEKPLVMIFDQGDNAVGILIDDYPKPLSALNLLQHLPQLPSVLKGHVPRGYVKDEMIWIEFDQNSFFDELTRNIAPHGG